LRCSKRRNEIFEPGPFDFDKDTTEFADRCGFPKGAEEKLGDMLVFKDVYYEDTA
jgi:hypothetical protein